MRRSRSIAIAAALLAAALSSSSEARMGPPSSHRGRVAVGFGFSYGYPYYGYPYYGYPAWAPYAAYPGWVGYPVPMAPPNAGFVRLKIRPEDAGVWVGGKYVGIADDFDGYPGALVLRPGTRTLTLRHPGYHVMKLRVDVAAGVEYKVRRHMAPLRSSEP